MKCFLKVLKSEIDVKFWIYDPSGNKWYMDGAGNIDVTTPENIYINAGKDINITAGENLNVNVGNDMKTNVGNDHTVDITNDHKFNSKNYKQTINEDKTITILEI